MQGLLSRLQPQSLSTNSRIPRCRIHLQARPDPGSDLQLGVDESDAKSVHERTAQAIETRYQGQLEDYYSELAHHYNRSGNTPKAIEYLQLAGEQAVQRSANPEASSTSRLLWSCLKLSQTPPSAPSKS